MAARGSLRRLAQQLRSSVHIRTCTAPPQRTGGLLGACERQGFLGARGSQRSRLLRQRSNMMPTLIGRSSRHILMAFRAMHYSVSVFGLDDDGT